MAGIMSPGWHAYLDIFLLIIIAGFARMLRRKLHATLDALPWKRKSQLRLGASGASHETGVNFQREDYS